MNDSDSTTPLFNRLKQVAITILSQRWFVIGYVIALILFGSHLIGVDIGPLRSFGMYGMLFISFPVMVAGNLPKYWFVRPEAKLVPGYHKPHLLIMVLILVAHFFILPILIGPVLDLDPIGLSAFTIGVVSCFLMLAATEKMHWFAAAGLIYATLWSPNAREFWFDSGLAYQPQRVLCLIAGWWLAGYWLLKQSRVHEESESYKLPKAATPWSSATRRMRSEQNQQLAKNLSRFPIITRLTDMRLERLLSSKKPRFHQLMRISLSPGPIPLAVNQALIMILVIGILPIILSQLFFEKQNLPWIFLAQLVYFPLVMPGVMNQTLLSLKKPVMGSEILRPIKREKYFRSLKNQLLLLTFYPIPVNITGIAGIMLLGDSNLLTPFRIALLTACCLASNFLVISIVFYFATFRSKFMNWGPPLAMIGVLSMVAINFTVLNNLNSNGTEISLETKQLYPIMPIALIVFFAGYLVLRLAYRKWLRTELG